MKKRFICLLLTAVMLFGASSTSIAFAAEAIAENISAYALSETDTKLLTDYVDMTYGVNNTDLCTIGPARPHASVTPGPDTYPASYSTGYLIDKPIRGFSQIHNNCGEPKYGNFLISPQVGLSTALDSHDSEKANEVPTAAEYNVTLSEWDIDVSVTPAEHSNIYKFTYPKTDEASIVIDMAHFLQLHSYLPSGVNITVDTDEAGNTIIYGGGKYDSPTYGLHFYAVVNKTPTKVGTYTGSELSDSASLGPINLTDTTMASGVGAYMQFSTEADETIMLKIAVSFTSVELAKSYLEDEIPAWDYDAVKEETIALWEEQLGKIIISGENLTEEQKVMFYTNFYCANKMPRDRTGDIEKFGDADMIDDHIAVWDTFRSTYPLYSITNPEFMAKTVNSFIARLEVNGWVRDIYNGGNERHRNQGGDNVDNIIAEAYLKGIEGVDWEAAYAVVKDNADNWRDDQNAWTIKPNAYSTYRDPEIGYIPGDTATNKHIMCCSKTVEYAYNDYLAAMMAKGLAETARENGETEKAASYDADYETYLARSNNWMNIWNEDLEYQGFKGWIWPRSIDGTFIEPNDTLKDPSTFIGSWKPYFYEGTCYSYSFFVPHDVETLIEKMGGESSFIARLQYGIDNGRVPIDNQPGMLQAYLFNHTSEPWHTSDYVEKLIGKYSLENGTPGCEDSGSLSSWYIFSNVGFFPNAGQDFYYLTSPKYETTTFKLANNKTFTVKANNLSEENKYIQSVTLNDEILYSTTINHSDIIAGGELVFNMGSSPVDYSSEVVASGKTAAGEYDWTLRNNGTLSIFGTGDGTLNFDNAISADNLSDIPWYDHREQVTTLNITEDTGITAISAYVLSNLPNCTKIMLPTSLTTLSESGIFANDPLLGMISVHGESNVKGEYNLFNIDSLGDDIFADSGAGLTLTLILGDGNFAPVKWFTDTTTVNFDLVGNTSAETWVKNALNGISDTRAEGYKFALGTYKCTAKGSEYVEGGNAYSWTLNTETGVLTFINDKRAGLWNELSFGGNYTAFINWIAQWKDEVEHIVIPYFDKMSLNGYIAHPFEGLKNLKTVKTSTLRWRTPASVVFSGCSSLTTLGTPSNFEEGKIKLDGIRIENLYDSAPGLFKNCISITDVDFTGFKTFYNDSTEQAITIGTNMLKGCTSLTNLNLTGVTSIYASAVSGCTSLKEVTIPVTVTSIAANAFASCTALTTVNVAAVEFTDSMAVLSSFPDQTGLTIYCQNNAVKEAFEALGYEKTQIIYDQYATGEETVGNHYGWSLDKETGILTFTRLKSGWNELSFTSSATSFATWVADWKDEIKHIVIPTFDKFSISADVKSPFAGLTNLETVKIDTVRWLLNSKSLFEGCTSLTTLGKTSNFEEGKIKLAGYKNENLYGASLSILFTNCAAITSVDFTGFLAYSDAGNTSQSLTIRGNCFAGCTSLNEVILADVSGISAGAFKGCTALESLTIPATLTTISATAFEGCDALTGVTLEAESFANGLMTTTSLPDREGLIVYCQNSSVMNAFNALGYTYTKAVNVNALASGGVSMEGFSIRTEGYNGLRGIFSFDKSTVAANEANGLTLVEYGAILSTEASKNAYGTDLTYSEGGFVTANSKIIKQSVWSDGKFVGKILSSTDDAVEFALTIVRYSNNYDTNVCMLGYSVWKDASGSFHYQYADCDNDAYDATSIYKVTLGMYKDGAVNAADDPDGVIWGVLEACAVTLTAGTDYRDGDRDMSGKAFGSSVKFANMPIYKVASDAFTGATNSASKNIRAISFTSYGDQNFTLLPDGDNYVAVFRGTGDLPTCNLYGRDGVSQLHHSYNSYNGAANTHFTSYLFNTDGEKIGYVDDGGRFMTLNYDYDANPEMLITDSTVHRRQPTPTLLKNAILKIKSVIVDEGITKLSNYYFCNTTYPHISTFIYANSVKSIGSATFMSHSTLVTVSPKGIQPSEGLIDLSGFTSFGSDCFNKAGQSEHMILLPKGVNIPSSFVQTSASKTIAISTDRNTLIEGFADLRGITAIASKGLMSTLISKVYLDDSITSLANDAFNTQKLTVYTNASNIDIVSTFASANTNRSYIGGISFEDASASGS